MNTHELIEATMLHALGLLEDDERDAYENAFDAAPRPVQQRVRTEARRMADMGDLIPEIEPTAELRPVVIAAVRAAIREHENEQRIAAAQPANNGVIGRVDATAHPTAHPTAQPPTQPTTNQPARATSQPRLSTSQRVHRAWRVTAVGFAAASIALGVITLNMSQTFQQAENRALVASLYDTIGANYLEDTIFDANTKRVAMTSADGSSTAVAAVWSNPDWQTARLFVKNLSTDHGKPLRLVVLNEEGEVFREIATFVPSGQFEDFDVDVNLATERRLAVFPTLTREIGDAMPVLLSTEGAL